VIQRFRPWFLDKYSYPNQVRVLVGGSGRVFQAFEHPIEHYRRSLLPSDSARISLRKCSAMIRANWDSESEA